MSICHFTAFTSRTRTAWARWNTPRTREQPGSPPFTCSNAASTDRMRSLTFTGSQMERSMPSPRCRPSWMAGRLGAPITQALAPFISPRVNDDNRESIRVEVLRLAGADGQPKVRLRFIQTGTASWWFGIDNVGLYTINTPVIKTQPQSQTIDAGTPVTFSVEAQGNPPLSYQWKFNGTNIAGATTNTYTIANVSATNAGQYKVVVSNSDGPTLSNPAQLTVVTFPVLRSEER